MAATKYKSRTWLVTVWSLFIITVFGGASIILKFSPDWMPGLLATLGGTIIAYIGGEKYIDSKSVSQVNNMVQGQPQMDSVSDSTNTVGK